MSDATTPVYVITGATSGIGYRTALELARRGPVILVGRNATRLAAVKTEIERSGGTATTVDADFSDIASVLAAAAGIVGTGVPIAAVLNCAGVQPLVPSKDAQGWETSFTTNHLGPLAFTDALIPHLAAGTTVGFVVSAVEDIERKPAYRVGFRGGRYISAEASARGEWQPGGSTQWAFDAYATSKQGGLAAVFTLAREYPELRFLAIEPGVNTGTGLSRHLPAPARMLGLLISPIARFLPYFSTPKRSGRMIARVLTDPAIPTATYVDEKGDPMAASKQVSDAAFAVRYVAESRALLASLVR